MKKFAAIALLSVFTLGCSKPAPTTPAPEATTDAPAAEMHGEAHGEGEMTEPPAQTEPAATEEKPAEAAAPAEAAPAEAAPAEPAKPE